MKVKFIENNALAEVRDSYGMRLIEQGKAVYVKQPKRVKPKEEPKQEKVEAE